MAVGLRCLLLAATVAAVAAVDRSKFRTCQDASFCRRHRGVDSEPEFRVAPDSVRAEEGAGVLTATVYSAVDGAPPFELRIATYDSGVARMRITEKTSLPPRWESPDIIQEHQLVSTSVRVAPASDEAVRSIVGASASASGVTYVVYSSKAGQRQVVAVKHAPLRVELYSSAHPGTPSIIVNEASQLYYEHRRPKPGSAEAAAAGGAGAGSAAGANRKIVGWGEDGKPVFEDGTHGVGDGTESGAGASPAASVDGLWEENFQSHHDSKPYGPTSVGVDIAFPLATHVYGIPEHASSHALKATDGSEGGSAYTSPYRLYNLDVFEYELDNTMALYGSIPMMVAHGQGKGGAPSTTGVFWNNPSESYVDISKGRAGGGVSSRWISESGVFDLWLLPGAGPKEVMGQYTGVTGTQGLPPLFALGYHQCRWNYRDEADVYGVDAKFEEHAFPYDVLWLDIEHADGKRYFTWNSALFPNPSKMIDSLAARGHKMVTIIDPHIKRDGGYKIHSEATSKGLYVKTKDGSDFDGWCWPGSSSYLDFTSPDTRSWWADQFSLTAYQGSTKDLYTWNDMNEPSVFNGPEVSMHKDAKSIAGVEHREWHNLYGFYQAMATAEGQLRRAGPDRNARTFLLSRAFYAGTQRYGAIWTGDNDAKWEHLAAASPMLLTIGVAGLTFAGADVGGFFHNPSTELMVRWYQAGAFQPFFRAHAHIDTARREPWLFGEEVLGQLRDIVRTRYTYLPLWYTLFHEANMTGVPTMRPLWMEYPAEPAVYGIDDQWMVGRDLLVKPITSAGATSTSVYFPGSQPWYDVRTWAKVLPGGGAKTVEAPLTVLPVYQRGGSIVPRQLRPRRASAFMRDDPYTLFVALDSERKAEGRLYLDDGASYDYHRKGLFRLRAFAYSPEGSQHVLRSSMAAGSKMYAPGNTVERLVIAGLGGKAPKAVTAKDSDGATRALTFTYDAAADVLTVRKPDVKVAYDWSVTLDF